MPWGMASINGLAALVELSFGLHCMVGVCLDVFAGVGEASFVEGFVLLGLHCKLGFYLMVVCGLGLGVGLGIKILGTHL